ncbi:MAG TPA: EamA family transporter [Chroococcales cyanobacterium]
MLKPLNRPALWKIVLALLIVYFVWGSTYLAIRVAVLGLPPFLFCAARYLAAGAIMLTLGFLLKHPLPSRRQGVTAAISGLLLLVGGNGAIVWAEQKIPSNLGALVVAGLPIWLLVWEGVRKDGDRPTPLGITGLLLGLSGMAVLMGPALLGGHGLYGPPLYLTLALVGSITWGFGQTFTRHGEMPGSNVMGNAISMLAAAFAFSLLAFFNGESARLNLSHPAPSAIWALLYLIVFGSCIAYSAFTWLVQNASPAQVSTYAYVNPVVAILLGAWLLHEPLDGFMVLGTVLILFSVALVNAHLFDRSLFQALRFPGRRGPVPLPGDCSTSGS